jgi:hypothetical protein
MTGVLVAGKLPGKPRNPVNRRNELSLASSFVQLFPRSELWRRELLIQARRINGGQPACPRKGEKHGNI